MKAKKRCREHNFDMAPPSWAKAGSHEAWQCRPWETVYRGTVWYCRHVLICTTCGRQEMMDSGECPDRPEDDGTIEFFDRRRAG